MIVQIQQWSASHCAKHRSASKDLDSMAALRLTVVQHSQSWLHGSVNPSLTVGNNLHILHQILSACHNARLWCMII